jgi:dolichol-phosphate mannosyltransferase
MGILLSVVMPAYNEEECIEAVVGKWMALLRELEAAEGQECRMIVINDGSKDNTAALLDSLAARYPQLVVLHQPNSGHGKTVYNGYQKALELGSGWVFQVDSDDQFLPEDFTKLWSRREESLFILGRRLQRNDPAHRIFITKIVRLLLAMLFRVSLADSNIPYRLIRGAYLGILLRQFKEVPFAPNIFLAVLAKRDGQKLMEIPITHVERATGNVSIVKWGLIKACLRSARELLSFSAKMSSHLKEIKKLRTAGGI